MRVGIVGAGIVGLAHAYAAFSRGHEVTLFERSQRAEGASIRNFGMIWPIGQPMGNALQTALESARIWKELSAKAGFWLNPCGSIHLAHRQDEWSVLEEFQVQARNSGYDCKLLNREQTLKLTPAANPENLLGGLYSSTELGVNPRNASHQIANWLSSQQGVTIHFGVAAQCIEVGANGPEIQYLQDGCQKKSFDLVVICTGTDFKALFPNHFNNSGIKPCKLQMLATIPQKNGWRIGPHIASGLTLRHYKNFQVCKSLAALSHRIATEEPRLDKYGIHVMASQDDNGEVILGDSHEYGDCIDPFDKLIIDELILTELRKIITLPDWTICRRWHGIYAKHPDQYVYESSPLDRVHVCTGTGGSGMTMSFGIADSFWNKITQGKTT